MPKIQKQRIKRKTKGKQIVIDTFLLYKEGGENSITAIASRNCDCADGSISAGLGFAPYQTDDGKIVEADRTFASFFEVMVKPPENGNTAKRELYAVDTNGYLYKYYSGIGSFLGMRSSYPVKKLITVWQKGEGTFSFFVMPSKITVQKNEGGEPQLLCGENRAQACICKNRIFYVYKNCDVGYTNPVSPDVWGESVEGDGILYANEKDGMVQGLAAVGDCVLVLYENGLKKIKAAGSPTDFTVESIDYHGGRIYYNTACACGKSVFFLAEEGVYFYDGDSVRRACSNMPIQPIEDDEKCAGACASGEYMLSYTDKNLGASIAVIKQDGKNGYFSDALTGMSAGGANRVIAQNGIAVGLYKRGVKCASGAYEFVSKMMDFGQKGCKTIKKIVFYGEGELYFSLYSDAKRRKTRIAFENGVAEWVVMERASAFNFHIQLREGGRLTKMVLDVAYC